MAKAPQTSGGGTTAFIVCRRRDKRFNEDHTRFARRSAPATVAMAASGGNVPRTATMQNIPTSARGSGTVIERTLPRSDQAPATDVFTGLTATEPERPGGLSREKSVAKPKVGDDKTRILIAAGQAPRPCCSWWLSHWRYSMRPGKVPDSAAASSPRAATQTQTPEATKPQTASSVSVPPSTIASLPARIESRVPPPPARESESTNTAREKMASADHSASTKKAQTKARRKNANSAPGRPPQQPTGIFAAQKFDPALLTRRAAHILSMPPARTISIGLGLIAERLSSLEECTPSSRGVG